MGNWFYDFKLKYCEKLEMCISGLIIIKDWFYDFVLKCWRKLWMFEADLSRVDFDLGSILWFSVKMSSSVDRPTHELDAKLFLKSQVEISKILQLQVDMLRKIGWTWHLAWFYDFKLKTKDVESWLVNSWFCLWIDLMIIN